MRVAKGRNEFYADKTVEYNGEFYGYKDIGEKLGITSEGVYRRVKAGWTKEQIMETPRGRPPAEDTSKRDKREEKHREYMVETFGDVGRMMNQVYALTMRWVGA